MTVFQEIRVNWTATELRQLRYRLGWSRAELAHSLGCELAVILDWEASGVPADCVHRNRLLLFMHQTEMIAENVQRRPVAEVIMKERGLAQIHETDVIESLATAPSTKTMTKTES
ncbi:MAG: hypothetical protein NDI61_12220 [Bdellovibrionaceae bacterium]|nr:hypothetical protein [Pseudobdellovibrionaceae bacterium]